MNWVEDVVRDFGRNMGFDELVFSDNGVLSLAFEKRGVFYIEYLEAEEVILIYLVRQVPTYADGDTLRTALRLTHYREGHPLTVQVGLKGKDTLVFLSRLVAREFSLPLLENAFELLNELHERTFT